MKIPRLLALLLLTLTAGISSLPAEERPPNAAQLARDSEEIIESYNLTNHAGRFGVVLLEMFRRPDSADFEGALESFLPPPSIEKVLNFSKSENVEKLRKLRGDIEHIHLAAFEYLSPEAFGLTYITVAADGPAAIEIRFYVSPDATDKTYVEEIGLHETWEAIRECLSHQRKLPGTLAITGTFEKNAAKNAEESGSPSSPL